MRCTYIVVALWAFSGWGCSKPKEVRPYALWYQSEAKAWTEALPIGNGRMGAMIFGGLEKERIQFNEETLWTGKPGSYSRDSAWTYLDSIRSLLFAGNQDLATEIAHEHFMSIPLRQMEYQPFGDLFLSFPGHDSISSYARSLSLNNGVNTISYQIGDTLYGRESFISHPDQMLVYHLFTDKSQALNFSCWLESPHESYKTYTEDGALFLEIAVKDGLVKGKAKLLVKSDGNIAFDQDTIIISKASKATLFLDAATNVRNYQEVDAEPEIMLNNHFTSLGKRNYKRIKKRHIADFQELFNRFDIDFGTTYKDSLPTDIRLEEFIHEAVDPGLIALYVQYGRYLLISSSREGTRPANLQGIWNEDLNPAWGSKYTTNINLEMNYWLAEPANLSECHEPLFQLIREVGQSGKKTAWDHYQAKGFVLHHNTDLWRGTAPINHANHGIWQGGGGWLVHHLWEHYLYTQDRTFLAETAFPLMKEAAQFYHDVLIQHPDTNWLISTPSNSPETGGLVYGPTMDHQIIRSLFKALKQADQKLALKDTFVQKLDSLIPLIAPNQIGRYGQLQEWVEDIDDPENKHRHVSHLWGVHPGKDINWDENPELMNAARQSLLYRGDEGTGWSLAWKINFWARFLDGDHAYDLIKLLFRPINSRKPGFGGGGSYPNLFDAHPPFQIDGNFGAAAGILELLVQSHMDTIRVLPALPKALKNGAVSGLRVRGGFEFDLQWEDGQLKSLKVYSLALVEIVISLIMVCVPVFLPVNAGAMPLMGI